MAPDGAGQDPAGSKSMAGLRRVVECVAAQHEELVRQRDELIVALRDLVEISEIAAGMGLIADRPDMNGPLPRARAVLALVSAA